MKNFKRIASAVAAIALAATMAVPMSAIMTATAAANCSITIQEKDAGYEYNVYKIFTGTESDGSLINLKWGFTVGSDDVEQFLDDLKTVAGMDDALAEDDDLKTDGEYDLDKIAYAVSQALEDADTAQELAQMLIDEDYVTPTSVGASNYSAATGYTLGSLDAGYYYIVNTKAPTSTDNPSDGAYSSYMLKVISDAESHAPKSAKPTVDKSVSDDDEERGDKTASTDYNPTNIDDGTGGWYESADHAINESFQFKLTATFVGEDDYAAYETYTVKFNDSMTSGITFDSIDYILVGETRIEFGADKEFADLAAFANNKYDIEISGLTAGGAGLTWSLTIADILDSCFDGVDLTDGHTTKIEVVYNVHLNENATAVSASGSITDNNKVNLEYSNNPSNSGNGTGSSTGKTPDDYVWVTTFQVDDTKKDGDGKTLKGAGFTLKGSDGEVIPLYYKNGVYYPYDAEICTGVKAEDVFTGSNGSLVSGVTWTSERGAEEDGATYGEEGLACQILTDTTGKIQIKGLDAGTYTLEETVVPDGYNPIDAITIKIDPEHMEGDGTENSEVQNAGYVKLNSDNHLSETITNLKGSTLPETGGIGTTLFYLIGGTLVVGAGVTLITKKRMQKD